MTSRTTDRTRIGADELIEIDGRLAKILSLNRSEAGDGLIALIQFGDGEFQRMKWADLARRLLNRQPSGTTPAADGPHSPLLEELPDTDRAHYLHVYRQLLQVSTGSPNGNPDADREAGVLEPAFDPNLTTKHQRVAAMVQLRRTRGEGGASPATIYRQLERVKQKGIDGLIHGNRKLPRDLLAAHDPAVVDRIRQFLALHKSEAQISTKRLIVLVAADLESRSLGTDMEKQTIGKLVGAISRGMALDRPASSRRTHSRKPDRVHGRHEVNAPGEMVQIDGTSTTIHVWDDKLHWVPAVVLDAIDCYSREVLALRVCARASTARDVAMLLSDIGRPTVSRAGWPYDLDHWHGVPRLACVVDQNRAEGPGDRIIGTKVALQPSTIVLDNGADMSSDQLVAAAERMGITVVFCPPATPHAKGMIEGVQNAIREIQSLLPGYKGENPVNHPAAIESGAMLTAQDLHDALWEYILTIYRWRPHQGLTEALGSPAPISPGQAFIDYISLHGGFIEAPSDPYRAILAMKSVECRLQDYGIRVDRRIYNSPELKDIARYYQDGLGVVRRKLTVYYDRYVTSHVFTRHPATGEWLRIPRKGHSRSAGRPWGELLTNHLVKHADGGGESQTLTDPQLFEAEKQFALRWRKGVYENRREQRIAAIEESRARQVAHDYEDLPEDLVRLAFGNPEPDSEPQAYVGSAAQASDNDDDDILDYNEIEAEDLAL